MAAAQCPPGMIPRVSHGDDIISTPEKLAECEKQVHEMNEKLSTLQFQTMQARAEMEEMAQQQRQLQLDNQLLRLRAEKADKQYLEELDSLSQIVGDVVSRANSTNKPSPGIRSSTNSTPLQSVPQSVAPGQSL